MTREAGAAPATPASRGLPRLAATLAAFSGWRRLLLAMLCGALAAAALPPFYALPLLLPAFVAALWLLDGASTGRQAALVGWAFGFGHFAAGLYWVGIAFLVDAARFGWGFGSWRLAAAPADRCRSLATVCKWARMACASVLIVRVRRRPSVRAPPHPRERNRSGLKSSRVGGTLHQCSHDFNA